MDRRMAVDEVKRILGSATADGVISGEQADRLLPYFTGEAQAADVRAAEVEMADIETPRFVRGFHDVLITIGVVVALIGVTGFASIFVTPFVIILLAEILVRRQRLALPAVVLTVATAIVMAMLGHAFLDGAMHGFPPFEQLFLRALPVVLGLGLFAWRYRVPFAFAGLLLAGVAFVFLLLFVLVERITGAHNVLSAYPLLATGLILACALVLFAVAMRHDLSDPHRLTRRSDVAFWLHLFTAPLLLAAFLALLGGGKMPILFGRGAADAAFSGALHILLVVTLLMVIGIVIDRRAFVTSGLVSLIAALVVLFRQGQLAGGNTEFLAMVIAGTLVLAIGIGWRWLRALTVGRLPERVRAKLPPVA